MTGLLQNGQNSSNPYYKHSLFFKKKFIDFYTKIVKYDSTNDTIFLKNTPLALLRILANSHYKH